MAIGKQILYSLDDDIIINKVDEKSKLFYKVGIKSTLCDICVYIFFYVYEY